MPDEVELDEELRVFAMMIGSRFGGEKENGIPRAAIESWATTVPVVGERLDPSGAVEPTATRTAQSEQQAGNLPASPEFKVTTYTVMPGDNLWKIGRTWLRERLDRQPTNVEIWKVILAICYLNQINDYKVIHPQTVLRLPEL